MGVLENMEESPEKDAMLKKYEKECTFFPCRAVIAAAWSRENHFAQQERGGEGLVELSQGEAGAQRRPGHLV